jgi:flagellin
MSLGVLNNIAAVYAENNLNSTQASLQNTLEQLSSGSRINSGADDAAGLSIADGLGAASAALTQSADNATQGVGLLQVADGALSQVTNLLNRAVTLATEASNGTLSTSQDAAANQEFQSILAEINNIGTTTTFNGNSVFSGNAVMVYSGDATTTGGATDALTIAALTSASVGDVGGTVTSTGTAISYTVGTGEDLSADVLTSATAAQTALTDVNTAITDVAAQRGYVGSDQHVKRDLQR